MFGSSKKGAAAHYTWAEENDLLGSGNFANVYKAVPKEKGRAGVPDGASVAIKVIDMSKVEDVNDIEREITIMQKINHPNVIKLFEVFKDDKKQVAC